MEFYKATSWIVGISLASFAAFGDANKVEVVNDTSHQIRAKIDVDPRDGVLISPGRKAQLDKPPTEYVVRVCWAGQDRGNHCVCTRESCAHSPTSVVVQGTFGQSCADSHLQLRCFYGK